LAVKNSYDVTTCGEARLSSNVDVPVVCIFKSSHLDRPQREVQVGSPVSPSMTLSAVCDPGLLPPGLLADRTDSKLPPSPYSTTSCSCT